VTRRPEPDAGASRLSRRDLLWVGSLGLRTRCVRAALSALGISIGIAAIVGVLGISQSSKTGLRRALGAARRHVAEQFLAEALLLSVLGGLAGTVVGAVATAIYAPSQHWSIQIPAVALCGGLSAALAIGAVAGLYPSMRAARLSPTEALPTV
jgi:putative ABC transport system permease protein